MNKQNRFFRDKCFTSKLRQLLVLFTFVLLPMGAWAEDYPILIGSVQLSSGNIVNYSGVHYGQEIKNGSLYYNVLTLDNASIQNDITYTSDVDLKVIIIGKNTFNGMITCTAAGGSMPPTITFERGDNTKDCSLVVTKGEWFVGGFLNSSIDQIYLVGFTATAEPAKGKSTIATDYHITFQNWASVAVIDIPVNSVNAADVLGDGKVSYSETTKTLTLNGVTFNGPILTDLAELTIAFSGNNVLGGTNSGSGNFGYIKSSNANASLTLKALSASSTLYINNEYGDPVVEGYAITLDGTYASYDTPFAFNTSSKRYEANYGALQTLTFTGTPTYMLWVGSVGFGYTQATEGNLADYVGNIAGGTVSFSGSTSTLTLNDAVINGDIVSGLGNLNIVLKGSSSITHSSYGGAASPIISANNGTLTFSAEGHSMLTIQDDGYSPYTDAIGGFESVVYNNDLVFFDYTSKQLVNKLYAPSISVNGIAPANEGVTIKYSIDYADGTADISNATYDASTAPFPISAPCVVTTHTEYGGKSSAEVKAKYFQFADAQTMTYNGAEIEFQDCFLPEIIPAIEASDAVTLQIFNSSNPSVIDQDKQSGGSLWKVVGFGTTVLSVAPVSSAIAVLNNSVPLTVNIIPDGVNFGLASGEYLSSQTITLTKVTTGNAVIKYKWGTNGTEQSYTEPIAIQAGTLYAWVEVTYLDANNGSHTAVSVTSAADYTVRTDLASAVATLSDGTYNGAAKTVTVKASAAATASLVEGTDYTISYQRSGQTVASILDAGEYTVTITGIGAYGGTASTTFTIAQAEITSVELNQTSLAYKLNTQQSVTVKKVMAGTLEVPADCYTVSGNTGTDVGNYTLTVTARTDVANNFKGGASAAWTITKHIATLDELGFNDPNQTFATYYNEAEDLFLPNGVVAYSVTNVDDTSVTTQRLSCIPKGVPVLLEIGDSNETAVDQPTANMLHGTTAQTEAATISGGTVYVLYNGEFVRCTEGAIPAGRCYLLVPDGSNARRLTIAHHGDNTTGVRLTTDTMDGEQWYDMQGRRINKPTKPGLYILNGKKVAVRK